MRLPPASTLRRLALHPYLLLFAACLMWAGNSITGRLAAGGVSPMVLTSMRWGLALVVVLVLARPHLAREREVLVAHWRILAALGVTGFALFNALLYGALNYTGAMNVVLIQAGLPAVVFVLSYLMFGTRVRAMQLVGFLVTLVGVSLVVAGSGEGLGVGLGEGLVLLGVLAYAGYTAALRLRPDVHWLSALAVMGTAAWLATLPLLAWEGWRGDWNWPSSAGEWALVGYAAVFPAILAQAAYMRGVDAIGANRAGMFVNLLPVTGVALAWLILGEAFGWREGAALALGVGGIWLAERDAPGTSDAPSNDAVVDEPLGERAAGG